MIHQPDFTLVIPTIVAKNLVFDCLNSIRTRHRYRLIVNASRSDCLASKWNQGINIGIKQCNRPVLFANDDILFWPKCLDEIIVACHQNPGSIITARQSSTPPAINAKPEPAINSDGNPIEGGFCLFAIEPAGHKKLVQYEQQDLRRYIGHKPGMFDENFVPAYFEDGDFYRRFIHCAGMSEVLAESAWYYHQELTDQHGNKLRGSCSVRSDSERRATANESFERNKARYVAKWGSDSQGREVYELPFNGDVSCG